MVSQDFIQQVLDRTDIVEIISSHIPLKRAGSNFKALCPFHSEKTPSFFVSPHKQIFHCFGCGRGGNSLHFIMEYERITFMESLKILASKAGLEIPRESKEAKSTSSILYKINELAGKIYHQNLLNNPRVKEYLKKRSLRDEDIERFLLGYATDSWDQIFNTLRSKDIPISLIEKAGLISPRQDGGFYDFFRNRIIIPIFDIKSRIIGFGGRRFLDNKDIPKYINSPQTEIYHKGRTLYGLNFSKEAILEKDYAILVEGYFDLIVPYSKGIKNILAPLGTSFTVEQARSIKRYTDNLVIIFDQDEAGIMASFRALSIFLEEEMNVKISTLPVEFDPDSYVREFGPAAFLERIEQAEDFIIFAVSLLKKKYSLTPPGKKKITSELFPLLSKIKNSIVLNEYFRLLAKEIDISPEALITEFNKFKKGLKTPLSPQESKDRSFLSAEKIILKMLFSHPQYLNTLKQKIDIEDYPDERVQKIMKVLYKVEPQDLDFNKVRLSFSEDTSLTSLLSELEFLEVKPDEDIFKDCLARISISSKEKACKVLMEEIRRFQQLDDEERIWHLLKKYHELKRVIEDEKKETRKGCRAYS